MRFPIILIAALLLAPAPARPLRSAEVPVLVIGMPIAPPFSFAAADGQVTGPAVTGMRDLAAAAGFAAQVRPLPYARVESELLASAVDVAAMADDGKRDADLVLLGVMATIRIAAIGRRDLALRSLADLRGRSVGSRRGGTQERFLPAGTGHNPVLLNDFGSGLQMLLRGRVDALVIGCAMLDAAAREQEIERAALGSLIVVGTADIVAMAAPGLRGTAKLAQLKAAWGRVGWDRLAPPEPWCDAPRR